MTASLTDTRSADLYRRALALIPGGVNSPVRAMRAIGRDPLFIARGEGAELIDVDGNRLIDYVCSWGPLIHGHAHPQVLAAVGAAAAAGTSFGAPTAGEVELAAAVAERFASVEMLRMTSSGTEATMTALRLARAATGREPVLKFAGAYHGHLDGLLAQARLGPRDAGAAEQPRRAGERGRDDDRGAVERPRGAVGRGREHTAGSDHRRAAAGEHGPRAAARGLPRAAARAGRSDRRAAGLR